MNRPSLILASQSPRRRELLTAAGIAHELRVAGIDESIRMGENPFVYVRRLAYQKALAVTCEAQEIVLAADTTVVCDRVMMGKPVDVEDARRMLQMLSGKRHEVITGVCLRTIEAALIDHEVTAVWFHTMSNEEIDEYLATGEPMDKAGAYGIQGVAARYIDRIHGSYSNVVGLPLALVWRKLKEITNSLSSTSECHPAE